MWKFRLSEEQIIGTLEEPQAGAAAKELCREHGMRTASFYIWGCLPLRKVFAIGSQFANIFPASPIDNAPKGNFA